ncbi:pilus protein PilZ [Geotalea uraniireducens]|uniref:Pilus protein PilZ n=1 Tax=Geotalea uraniireducens TaxID=351604 RepID=A0ABM8EP96_9BACT|nr:PilZ-like domain-containing protein [Geotalea uraniireducens]BDV44420.1 pilus protein PilZ [Geotalea uraniireducens]
MSSDYGTYFEVLQKINLAIRLDGGGSFDGTAAITALKGDLVWLELYGNEQPPQGGVCSGADASLSVWTAGALCRCDASVEGVRDDRQFVLRFTGAVRELQRREYFRLDVEFPFIWSVIPAMSREDAEAHWLTARSECQSLPEVVPAGDSFKVVGWNGNDVSPQRANLSGGGVRFKVSEWVEAGSLLEMTLFLPFPQPRIVLCVAEALRCQEISLTFDPGTHYQLSLKFVIVGEKDREAIITYLFAEQRRELMMKKQRISFAGGR